MRNISDIDAEIAFLDEKRRILLDEREKAIRARNLNILQMFDDEGMTFNAIAIRVGQAPHTVKQFLFNHGRTVAGRAALRAQLASINGMTLRIPPR